MRYKFQISYVSYKYESLPESYWCLLVKEVLEQSCLFACPGSSTASQVMSLRYHSSYTQPHYQEKSVDIAPTQCHIPAIGEKLFASAMLGIPGQQANTTTLPG